MTKLWQVVFVCLCFGATLTIDADPTRRRSGGRDAKNPSSVISLPAQITDASLVASLRYWLTPHAPIHMGVEGYITTGCSLTHPVAASSSAVAEYVGPENITTVTQAVTSGSTGHPTLQFDGTYNYLNFTSTGVNDRMAIDRSTRIFQHITENRLGTVIMHVQMTAADGTAQVIGDSMNLSTANVGAYFYRTSGNRINVVVSRGGGSAACNHTTAASVLAADGRVAIVWRGDGAGGVRIRVGSASEETFSCALAGVSSASGFNFTIGGQANSTSTNTNFRLYSFQIYDTNLSDEDLALALVLPTPTTGDLVRERPAADGYYSHLYQWYDFRVAANMLQVGGAAVTAAGQTIGTVYDSRDPLNRYSRGATAVGAAPPTWQDTDGLDWSGAADQSLTWTRSPIGCGWRTSIVSMRQDHTLGSAILQDQGELIVTGPTNTANPLYPWNSCYHAVHPASGSGVSSSPLLSCSEFNILQVTRAAGEYLSYDGAGTYTNPAPAGSTNTARWTHNNFGTAGAYAGRLDGRIRYWFEFAHVLTAAQRARVVAGGS